MSQQPEPSPSIGGASLECVFAYDHLCLEDLEVICDEKFRMQLRPVEDDPFVVTDADFTAFDTPPVSSFHELFSWSSGRDIAKLYMKLVTQLHDSEVRISISADFVENVVSISTAENMLWGFTEEVREARFERLDAFYTLCEQVSLNRVPTRAVIGSEPCHTSEISLKNPDSKRFMFSREQFFSDAQKRELFDWYVEIYARRWDQSRHIDIE